MKLLKPLFCFMLLSALIGACLPTSRSANNSLQSVIEMVEYSLQTDLKDGKMIFIGQNGAIKNLVNPDLKANSGDTVRVTLISGEGMTHNIRFDGADKQSSDTIGQGKKVTFEFAAPGDGTYAYYCAIPGHRQAGMEGKFIVGTGAAAPTNKDAMAGGAAAANVSVAANQAAADPAAIDIVRDPTDLPGPIGSRAAQQIRVDLETVEVSGKLADGATYHYWTFNEKVPGPFIRVRVGDTIDVHLINSAMSSMSHSVDFHAVTGPGGGAVMTQTMPGGETTFTFKALNPGVFVYHCATPMVADHISNGMYGMILVEPDGGLAKVDREFYVMQGEIYTTQPYGAQGSLTRDTTKLLNETPDYFVFNGAVNALASETHQLKANVGESVRIFFGVGGPNFVSSFHVIGEIFDRVYDQGSLTSAPLTNVQTTLVPPGGAAVVEFTLQVPGRYILVDHALVRMQRGLMGYLVVTGDPAPEIYQGTPTSGSGH